MSVESMAMAEEHSVSPALLATQGIRRWTWIGIAIIAVTFGGAALWSALVPLSSAVIAPGLIKVDTSRKKIQHLEGGVVKEILVRDGDAVKAGDVLIRLDQTRADASHGIFQSGLDAALAQQARLIAEQDGHGSILFPPDLLARRNDPKVAKLINSQISLFHARRGSFEGQLNILDKQIVFLQDGIEGLNAQQLAKEEQLNSQRSELDGYSVARSVVEKNRMRAIEREISRLDGERAAHVSDIAKTRTSISEKELEKFQIRKKFREEVGEELRKVQTEINDFLERVGASRHVLEQTDIKAPVDGTVVDSRTHTPGGVIGPGELLLEIVPANDRLVLEARARPEDIDRLRVGLPAGIKLSAFDQRTTPELEGRVSYVSADTIEDAKSGIAYFLIKVEVPESELKRLQGRTIQPGMMADVFVRTGERTFFSYLMDPLIDSFNKAWREK